MPQPKNIPLVGCRLKSLPTPQRGLYYCSHPPESQLTFIEKVNASTASIEAVLTATTYHHLSHPVDPGQPNWTDLAPSHCPEHTYVLTTLQTQHYISLHFSISLGIQGFLRPFRYSLQPVLMSWNIYLFVQACPQRAIVPNLFVLQNLLQPPMCVCKPLTWGCTKLFSSPFHCSKTYPVCTGISNKINNVFHWYAVRKV